MILELCQIDVQVLQKNCPSSFSSAFSPPHLCVILCVYLRGGLDWTSLELTTCWFLSVIYITLVPAKKDGGHLLLSVLSRLHQPITSVLSSAKAVTFLAGIHCLSFYFRHLNLQLLSLTEMQMRLPER